MIAVTSLRVGSLVIAKRHSAVCEPGERGVVYEVYCINGCQGWGVIFARGAYDGFNADDVEAFLELTGEVCAALVTYVFRNVLELARDFDAARFAPAFVDAPASGPVAAQLETTLAFEQIVDACCLFRRLVQATAGAITVGERVEMREAVAQLLNESYPSVREAAESRFVARVNHNCFPALRDAPASEVRAALIDALDDYRHGLRQVPIRGVGVLV